MRAGYLGNAVLQEALERADPWARLIAQAVITLAEDIKDTRTEWATLDSQAGVTKLPEGGIRLTDTSAVLVQGPAQDAGEDMIDLNGPLSSPASEISAAVIEWTGPEAENEGIFTLTANLHPDQFSTGRIVQRWMCRLYRLAEVDGEIRPGIWRLQEIGQAEAVALAAPGDVVFQFSRNDTPPTPGNAPQPQTLDDPRAPTTVVLIWGVEADGSLAGNTAWRTKSGILEHIDGQGRKIQRYQLTPALAQDEQNQGLAYFAGAPESGVPDLQISGATFTSATVEFTNNPVDLGLVPTSVEFVFEADLPSDSAVKVEVWDGADWLEFGDGDLAGETNSVRGGFDLSTVALQQTYQFRLTLTPSTNSRVSPVVRRVGARSLTTFDLDETVVIADALWSVDPITLKPNIPSLELTFLRDGIRDFRDFATELFSENHIGDLAFRIFWGHPDLPRRNWFHVDDFLVDRVVPDEHAITAFCVSPLSKVKRTIPVVDTTQSPPEKVAAIFNKMTPEAAYSELLDQIGLAGRLRGPGLLDDAGWLQAKIDDGTLSGVPSVTKTIKDERKGKEELDRFAALFGAAVVSSQGRLKSIDMFSEGAPLAAFSLEETAVVETSPGWESRITDYTVPFGWDPNKREGNGDWSGESRHEATNALTKLGRGLTEETAERLDDEAARWIEKDVGSSPATSELADAIGGRVVKHVGPGLNLWQIESPGYPRPWLEPGDPVVVEQDQFTARDPHSDQPIRGRFWARGRVAGCNLKADKFWVWMDPYATLRSDGQIVRRIGFADPKIIEVFAAFGVDGSLRLRGPVSPDTGSVRFIASDTEFQLDRPTIRLETAQAIDSDGYFDFEVSPAASFDLGTTAFITGLAFEKPDGTGAEQVKLFKLEVPRDAVQLSGEVWVAVDTSTKTLDVFAKVEGPDNLFPATLELRQNDPEGAPIDLDGMGLTVHTFTASGETIGPTGSGKDTEYSGLTDFALGKSGIEVFYGRLVAANGVVTSLVGAGDLDSLPGGYVDITDSVTAPTFRCIYDDDVREIVISVPGGKFKTFTPLSGGGLSTYQVSVDPLDDASTEDVLAANETRSGYVVTYYGAVSAAGPAVVMFDGDIHGPEEIVNGSITANKLTDQAKSFITDIIFSASDWNTVAWTAGTLELADGSTFAIVGGNTGNMSVLTYIYFDQTISTTVLQVTTSFSDAVGENKILMAVCKQAATSIQSAFFVPGVGILGLNQDQLGPNSVDTDEIADDAITASQILAGAVIADKISAGAIIAGKIAAGTIVAGDIATNTITAAKMNVIELSAIVADLGTITAGTIEADVIVASESFTAATANFQGVSIANALGVTGLVSFSGSSGNPVDIASSRKLRFLTSGEELSGTIMGGATGRVSTTGIWEFAGEIRSSADIVGFYTSDRRLKKHIRVIDDPLERLALLQGITFAWNKRAGKAKQDRKWHKERRAGLIAQDVQKALPEAVFEGENGMLRMQYEQLIPLLVEGINALAGRIETPKAQHGQIEGLKRWRAEGGS